MSFFQLANRHGLVPLAYRNGSLLVADLIPADIMDKLKHRYQNIAQRNLQIIKECVQLKNICEALDIPIVFYKGFSLAIELYNDPTLRSFADNDVFIDKKYHSKIIQAFKEIGYKPQHHFTSKQMRYQLRHYKDFALRAPTSDTLLELHWHFCDSHLLLKPLTQNTKQHIKSTQWQNKHFTTLQLHEHCCLLALSGAQHGWKQYRHLLDFYHCYQLCEQKKLAAMSKRLGVCRHVNHAIISACKIFNNSNTQLKFDTKSHQSAKILIKIITKNNKAHSFFDRIQKYRLLLSLADTFQLRLDEIKRMMRSSQKDWSVTKLPDGLFLLYHIIRPFNWIYIFCIKPLKRKNA
ncbi:MAG: nucleotidyltransferase family protein [Coxiellaceae bacterium]|nr:nucleotidyltransferase family protein [Coxiellaceae bacterium]